jgi:hypothetical protein
MGRVTKPLPIVSCLHPWASGSACLPLLCPCKFWTCLALFSLCNLWKCATFPVCCNCSLRFSVGPVYLRERLFSSRWRWRQVRRCGARWVRRWKAEIVLSKFVWKVGGCASMRVCCRSLTVWNFLWLGNDSSERVFQRSPKRADSDVEVVQRTSIVGTSAEAQFAYPRWSTLVLPWHLSGSFLSATEVLVKFVFPAVPLHIAPFLWLMFPNFQCPFLMWMLHMQRRGGERRAYIPSFWLSGGAVLGGYCVVVFVLVFFF